MIRLIKPSPFQALNAKWRLIDNSKNYLSESALKSFAFDDTLCQLAGKTDQPSLRFWVHDRTIVLGTQDTRLDHIHDAITILEKNNYRVIVRNSGGLAVLLDNGVLNLSLIFPGETTSSIDGGYERMVAFIRAMFPLAKIDTGEIVGSYCPGSYDLSIDGKKFAGISQRRIRGGIAVQIYLCITGSGSERAQVVRDMYSHAVKEPNPKFTAPDVTPTVMASLNELLDETFTVEQIVEKAKQTAQLFDITLNEQAFSADEALLFDTQLERVIERHNRCLN
ncbi:biotin/lipoate A/B protein ligase family protein [Shouchella sp. JSM 1781072]|uniref:lipoate--protein ligase family protein n=1 Tax=Bacillaceae TaxID=186817 RepID=UPI000C0704EF|nr:lipoate--protein ligase family protein [Bacillus sp. Marseille-P3800]